MLKEVTMYTLICDKCGKDAFSETEFSCWNEPAFCETIAEQDGWHCMGNVHYCQDCYSFDDNGNLIIKP